MNRLSRRAFLKFTTHSLLALGGALAIGGIIRFLSHEADAAPQNEFDIGPAANFPRNSRTMVPDIPAIVIHDGDGIRAFSLACSHLGCAVEERNSGFECPCHGSRYDLNGVVIQGPAGESLRKLRILESEDGNLHIFTG